MITFSLPPVYAKLEGMLNIFPDLLSYGLLAPFLLRLVVGIFFVRKGIDDAKKSRVVKEVWGRLLSFLEVASGILLIVGAKTQIVSIITLFLSIYAISKLKERGVEFYLYLLLATISISLLFSGAGFLAVDLPL